MRLSLDQPIDDTVPSGIVRITGLRGEVDLADALRAVVTEHRLRGLITGAYLGNAQCRSWEGLDSSRDPGASVVRMNGGIHWILPAVEPLEPDDRDDMRIVIQEFCVLNPGFTAFEGYVLRALGDGAATMRASCWATADRYSDLVDLLHGHRGVPAGWAYLGVPVHWAPGRARVRRSRPRRLDELTLSTRTRNRLSAAGIASVDDLLTCSHADLWRVPGVGLFAQREIDAALAEHGLDLPWHGRSPQVPEHEATERERSEPVEGLRLPASIVARLAAGDVTTVGHIVDLTRADLLRIKGIGDGAVSAIRGRLEDRGLSLKVYERRPGKQLPRRDPKVTIDALYHAGLITTRPWRALLDAGIDTVGKLAYVTDRELLALPGLGPSGVARVREALERLGFELGKGAQDG